MCVGGGGTVAKPTEPKGGKEERGALVTFQLRVYYGGR